MTGSSLKIFVKEENSFGHKSKTFVKTHGPMIIRVGGKPDLLNVFLLTILNHGLHHLLSNPPVLETFSNHHPKIRGPLFLGFFRKKPEERVTYQFLICVNDEPFFLAETLCDLFSSDRLGPGARKMISKPVPKIKGFGF